jgi:Holliday junction DNA helicase RuvA
MFNSLYGTITAKLPRTVYLETGGIEWEILVPDSALDLLPRVGENARIYTWLYHREDAMSIFGFPTPNDRFLFFDLLKVDGVGAKAALKIMSAISSEQLRSAIDNEELSRLESVSGIGKKTAQKMMLALKGKLTFPDETHKRTSAAAKPWQDVIAALLGMGYDRRDTEAAIERLTDSILQNDSGVPKAVEFEAMSREAKEELLLRRAILELSR